MGEGGGARRVVVSTVRKSLARAGFSLIRTEELPVVVDPLEIALTTLLDRVPILRIVQVGANDGQHGDPLHAFVMGHRDRTRCLLLEPQSAVVPKLRATYLDHPAATIVTTAVGPEDSLTLFTVLPRVWPDLDVMYAKDWPAYRAPTGIASADREHVRSWLRTFYRGRESVDSLIAAQTVPCAPLRAILQDQQWDGLDVLVVDTEGFDAQVIAACDIPALRPSLIRFEHAHLTGPDLDALLADLHDHSYETIRGVRDTLAVRVQP